MGFDLTVFTPSRPADIKTLWEREFAALGFEVEIYPGFSPDSCNGGFLPFRVAAAPELYIGLTLAEPAVSGFEIRFDADAAHLWTGTGRTTTQDCDVQVPRQSMPRRRKLLNSFVMLESFERW